MDLAFRIDGKPDGIYFIIIMCYIRPKCPIPKFLVLPIPKSLPFREGTLMPWTFG
jgi:hypothetical protein